MCERKGNERYGKVVRGSGVWSPRKADLLSTSEPGPPLGLAVVQRVKVYRYFFENRTTPEVSAISRRRCENT